MFLEEHEGEGHGATIASVVKSAALYEFFLRDDHLQLRSDLDKKQSVRAMRKATYAGLDDGDKVFPGTTSSTSRTVLQEVSAVKTR